ncbi:MAG: L-rhamnose mutarotase [Bacteroidota bacterium]
MIRNAFKMKLKPGFTEEYKNRHDKIWPELVRLLRESGIYNYSIYLDEEIDTLFAYQELNDDNTVDEIPYDPIIQKWWYQNKDLMDCNPDNSPVITPLKELFFMS